MKWPRWTVSKARIKKPNIKFPTLRICPFVGFVEIGFLHIKIHIGTRGHQVAASAATSWLTGRTRHDIGQGVNRLRFVTFQTLGGLSHAM
jgi:hypothetical protein